MAEPYGLMTGNNLRAKAEHTIDVAQNVASGRLISAAVPMPVPELPNWLDILHRQIDVLAEVQGSLCERLRPVMRNEGEKLQEAKAPDCPLVPAADRVRHAVKKLEEIKNHANQMLDRLEV